MNETNSEDIPSEKEAKSNFITLEDFKEIFRDRKSRTIFLVLTILGLTGIGWAVYLTQRLTEQKIEEILPLNPIQKSIDARMKAGKLIPTKQQQLPEDNKKTEELKVQKDEIKTDEWQPLIDEYKTSWQVNINSPERAQWIKAVSKPDK